MGSCRLEHGAFGNDALCDIAPQGDEEFAGQRHDGDAANSSLAGADPRLKPAAQRQVRLVAQPEPGNSDSGVPQATIAQLGDPLIPFDAAALPGAGRQSRICRYLASRLPKLRNNNSSQRSDANSGPMPLSLRRWAAGLFRPSAFVRMSAWGARSTAASCVAATAIRSSSRRISAFNSGGSHGRRRFAAPRAVRNNLAEASCNPGCLGR